MEKKQDQVQSEIDKTLEKFAKLNIAEGNFNHLQLHHCLDISHNIDCNYYSNILLMRLFVV